MAENISSCKALGGGDFTSLAAWEAWAEVSGALGETAECYDDGGYLGDFNSQSHWAAGSGQDADNHTIIRAADGHGHGGDPDSGARMGYWYSTKQNYSEVRGMRMDRWYLRPNNVAGTNIVGNKCYDNIIGGQANVGSWYTFQIYAYAHAPDADFHDLEVYNNIILGTSSTATNTFYIYCYTRYTPLLDLSMTFHNNLIIGNGTQTYGWYSYIHQTNINSHCVFTVDFYNNMAFRATSKDFYFRRKDEWGGSAGSATYVKDAQNLISADATGDDWGGSNHQISKPVADCIQDWANGNFEIVRDGPAHDTGKTHAVVTDMLGRARPQDDYFDIGPLELLASDVSTYFGSPIELLESFVTSRQIPTDLLGALIESGQMPVELATILVVDPCILPVELIQPDRVFHGSTKRVWTVVDNGTTWTVSGRGKTWTIPKRTN